jgi:phosphoglycerate dehydrogenase-like enzyme
MRILIPDLPFSGEPDIERDALASLLAEFEAGLDVHRHTEASRLPADVWRRADAVIVSSDRLTLGGETVGQLERCKIIVRGGVGFDNVDVAAASRRNIPVCNVPDYGTDEVADHAIAMMLALRRGLVSYAEYLGVDPVAGWRFDVAPLIRRMKVQRFGVVGLGRIGRAAALRASAFGMRILYYDPFVAEAAYERKDSLAALLAEADVVSLHCPLTPETRAMIGAPQLALMRPGSLLINTARGAVVDIDALPAALRAGRPGGAGLDVLPQEPPDPDHELIAAWRLQPTWLAGRLLLSPHAAFFSPESIRDLRFKAAATVRDALSGAGLRHCVNLEQLDVSRLQVAIKPA